MSNTLYLGGAAVDKVYLGSPEADAVYLGATKVWSSNVTVTASVAATGDDGYAHDSVLAGSSVGFAVQASVSGQYGFVRFSGLSVPQGATITGAAIGITAFSSSGGANCTISAVAADNPGTPSAASDVISATRTTHAVSWVDGSTLTAPATSPDLAAIVQEIVDRPGWASGNAVLFVAALPNGSAFTRGADKAETLTVTYS